MPTENTSKYANAILFLFGSALLMFLHAFGLGEIPGLHFDEAWAMNHAFRISEGEFTLQAMSPYTAPWAHYWAAIWMKLFGPSVLVFRASQVFLSLAGAGLLALALHQSGRRTAAALLPLTLALLPGLVLNQRFAIELTGFHAFCFGLFAYSLVRGWALLAVAAWVAGTTGHILFYGLGLAVIAAAIWEGRELTRRERLVSTLGCFLLALFFFRVFLMIPEKGKAGALVASALATGTLLAIGAEKWKFWRRHWLEGVVLYLALVFLFNAFVFLDGFWQHSVTTGREGWKGGRMVSIALFFPFVLWLTQRGSRDTPRWLRRAFLLLVILLGLMMLKPAPRYFEILLLALGVFAAQGLARLPFLGRMAALVFLLLHGTLLYAEYFTTTPKEASLRFLFFKDSSRDFLSKQELASVLGGSGCALSDIQAVDSRVNEALTAISRADWQVAPGGCRFKNLQVERRAESGRAGTKEEVADFVIWEK
jgi:hypothetical protein